MSTVSEIDGLVQDCSNSIALAMELLQSYTKPSINVLIFFPCILPWWVACNYIVLYLL